MSEEKKVNVEKVEIVEKVVKVEIVEKTKSNVVKLSSLRKSRVVEIKTEEGELIVEVKSLTCGDEMDSNQVSTKLLNLKGLAEKRKKGEKEIDMTEHVEIDQVKLNVLRVLKGIVSWNLAGDDGVILPVSEETLKQIPQTIFDEINKAIESCSYVPTDEELKN